MMKTLRGAGLLSLAGWLMLSPGAVDGRELDSATTLYSQGVHAYFAGRASEAESLLSRALEIDGQDPRIRYFRALSRLRLGRAGEARSDMAAGAALEAARTNRYAVGNALVRVQGSHRLLLEQYRREARAKAATVGAEITRQRAEQMDARDAGALRKRVVIPLDKLFGPGQPQALSAEEAARRAAILQPAKATPTGPTQIPPAAATANDADEDPFRDDATPPARQPTPQPAAAPSPPPKAAPIEENADDNPFDF